MPIEVNRIKRDCPACKNQTIFATNKGYFCGACLTDFPKDHFKEPESNTVGHATTDNQQETASTEESN